MLLDHFTGLGPAFVIVPLAYALGCLSTGYYLVRWMAGRDLRAEGSGSTGARNVSRVLGRKGFALTALGDFLKGAVAMAIAEQVGLGEVALALTLAAVVAGHIWPAQLRFSGGKGLVTAFGAAMVLDWKSTIVCMTILCIVLAFTRRSLLAAMTAVVLFPVVLGFFDHTAAIMMGAGAVSGMILWAHRENMRKEANSPGGTPA